MVDEFERTLVNTAGILDDQASKRAQFEIEPSNRLVSVADQRYVINPYSLGWSNLRGQVRIVF